MTEIETKIFIRRQWNDWQIGKVNLTDLENLGWDSISGGIRSRQPGYFIFGYTSCRKIEGEINHSCLHGEGPHWIKVCIVKKDNLPEVYKKLLELVGPKPKSS